ncbi:MAG: methyltransferase [Acidobacteria bacterium]|nr:methyltransferase [Acidobacteriota bacterium]
MSHFLNGRITLHQPRRGYRFSVDAPILADFVECAAGDELLEIGSGTGIIPLILARKKIFQRIVAVEIQPELAELARKNVAMNEVEPWVEIITADIRRPESPLPRSAFDGIVSNPPYRRIGVGRLNPDHQKAAARHELCLTLADLFQAADRHLKPSGALFMIHLGERRIEVRAEGERRGFRLGRYREVFSFPTSVTPCLALFQWQRNGGEEIFLPPLFIFDEPGRYSDEFGRIIAPLPEGGPSS